MWHAWSRDVSMKIQEVKWMSHSELPIFSTDIQPVGDRVATGGSDNKIRIWNLRAALAEGETSADDKNASSSAAPKENPSLLTDGGAPQEQEPRQLAILSSHTAPGM